MHQGYYDKFEGFGIAEGTRRIAEHVQTTAPFPVPDSVAMVCALALTAETLVGLSSLHIARNVMPEVDDTLDGVTDNFVIAIKAATLAAGLSHAQFKQLLKLAEAATIADLKERDALFQAQEEKRGAPLN